MEIGTSWASLLCAFRGATAAAAAAKSLQSCPNLCDPIDGSSPDSAVPGILQARTLEWVAISFSNAWKWKVKVKLLSLDPMDYSPPGSSIRGIFQARVLEWVAIAFSLDITNNTISFSVKEVMKSSLMMSLRADKGRCIHTLHCNIHDQWLPIEKSAMLPPRPTLAYLLILKRNASTKMYLNWCNEPQAAYFHISSDLLESASELSKINQNNL